MSLSQHGDAMAPGQSMAQVNWWAHSSWVLINPSQVMKPRSEPDLTRWQPVLAIPLNSVVFPAGEICHFIGRPDVSGCGPQRVVGRPTGNGEDVAGACVGGQPAALPVEEALDVT